MLKAKDVICWLKSIVLHWKKKITNIIISRRKRNKVLVNIGLYLLCILLGFFIIFLITCAFEYVDSVDFNTQ